MSNRLEKPIPRRDFLGLAALGTFFASLGVAFVGILRLPNPSVLPEPSQRYKVGDPSAFSAGEGKTPPGKNLYIFRTDKGLCAISSVCTHLGCIVKQTPEGFDCPCHGSRFDPQGKVTGGPAPRSLDWFALSVAPDGQLLVDEGKRVKAGTYLQA